MTTFRRFCCNDLLRFGPINLQPMNMTHTMQIYMSLLLKWPANCHVVYLPGGQVTGYIFGTIEGTGVNCNGWMSLLSISIPDELDLDRKLAKLLEDCCDKIYNAYTMKLFLPADDTKTIRDSQDLGFRIFAFHSRKPTDFLLGDKVEMRKPLPLLVAAKARQEEEALQEEDARQEEDAGQEED